MPTKLCMKPYPINGLLPKQQCQTQGRMPRKERREDTCPQTTTVPNGAPSFLDHLNPEECLVFSALAHDKDAQMLYVLNLGRAPERPGASNALSGRSMVQVSHVPNPQHMMEHMNKVGKSSGRGLLPWRIISKPLPSHPLGLLLLLPFSESTPLRG